MKILMPAALVAALYLSAPSGAAADYFEDYYTDRGSMGSPELLAVELRIGPYVPDVGNGAFTNTFGSDDGLLFATEVDVLPFRIPHLGLAGLGLGIGWSGYGAKARGDDGLPVDEEVSLDLFPLSLVGVLRVDALARDFGIPFLFTGKLGVDYVMWSTTTGSASAGRGADLGLRWALQAAFELDIFDRQAARTLDEEWGINHSFFFVEVYGSGPQGSPPMGAVAWAAGLGFVM